MQVENDEDKENNNAYASYLYYCCDKCDFRVAECPEFILHLDMNHNEMNPSLLKTEEKWYQNVDMPYSVEMPVMTELDDHIDNNEDYNWNQKEETKPKKYLEGTDYTVLNKGELHYFKQICGNTERMGMTFSLPWGLENCYLIINVKSESKNL